MSLEFLLTSFIVVATPGTGALYTITAGLTRGARASLVAAFACTLGILPHMLAAITGLAALLNASAVAFDTLKYCGVTYLLYMAWAMLRDAGGAVSGQREEAPRSVLSVIRAGVLINLLNPKLTIFFFAFLPQFVSPGTSDALPRMVALSGVFMFMTFVVFAAYGRFAAAMRSRVLARPRILAWVRRGFAGAFAGLGVKLVFSDR